MSILAVSFFELSFDYIAKVYKGELILASPKLSGFATFRDASERLLPRIPVVDDYGIRYRIRFLQRKKDKAIDQL